MIDDLEFVSISQLCSKISVGFVGTTTPFFCEKDKGVPLLRSKNVKPGKLNLNDLAYVTHEFHNKNKKSQLKKGDILIVRVGQNRGDVCKVDSSFPELNVANCVFLRPKPGYSDYIEILLRSRFGRKLLLSISTGSAQEVLNTSEIANLEIPLPDSLTIVESSKTINLLDDKITLLKEQNETLETLAQTLFKRWFVEFEFPISTEQAAAMGKPELEGKPYKSSGGKMIESELGEIPDGWVISYLNKLVDSSIGGDYGKEEETGLYTEQTVCLRGTDLPDMLSQVPNRAPIRYLKPSKLDKCKLVVGDIVIEISGGTEGQSTGRAVYIINEILTHFDIPMTCVNFCRILRPSQEVNYSFIYSLLKYLYQKGVFFNLENGSTGIKNLDLKTLLNDYEMVIPESQIIKSYHTLTSPFHTKAQQNNKEIQSLTKLRDTLLPKLMSGELRVKN